MEIDYGGKNIVQVEDIKPGDCFLWKGLLYLMLFETEEKKQYSVFNLTNNYPDLIKYPTLRVEKVKCRIVIN